MNYQGLKIGGPATGGNVVTGNSLDAQAVGPDTQFDKMRNRIGSSIEGVHAEIQMLRDTLSSVLPAPVPEAVPKDDGTTRPPEHSSPLMEFLRHVETSLGSMHAQIEYMRVRTPF